MSSRMARYRRFAPSALLLILSGLLVQGGDAWGDMVLGENHAAGLTLIAIAIVLGIAAIAVATRTSARDPAATGNFRSLWPILAALLVIHSAIAVHLLRSHDHDSRPNGQYSASDPRRIDCYTFQVDAAHKLLHRINPYGSTQANLYSAEETARYFGPGMVLNGRVQIGLQYPPVTFLTALPGYMLGDVRYGYLVAVLLAAIFVFATVPSAQGLYLAAFLLLDPFVFMVEDRCWTEPLVWMLLCATCYAAIKRPRWLPLALGLFLASKQYNILALPLIGLLLRPFTWKTYWKLVATSLAVAAATLLPFALVNVGALWHDLALFHLAQPLRHDALSFGVAWPPYMKIGPLFLLAFIAWVTRRVAGQPPLFAAAYGMAMLLFVSASKQAFMNYYFLISQSLLFTAVILWPVSTSPEPIPDQSAAEQPRHEYAQS